MGIGGDLGIEPERLKRRANFLEQRAKAHLLLAERGKREFERLCAATLHRDAAALLLMLNESLRARNLLRTAGREFTELGLFQGYLLSSLADPEPKWLDDPGLKVALDLLHTETRAPSAPTELSAEAQTRAEEVRARRPFISSSVGSTRQLTHLYQALTGFAKDDNTMERLLQAVGNRLAQCPGVPIGPTGVPLKSYIRTLEESRHGDLSSASRDALSAYAGLRAEQLEAAKADTHHWQMALSPTDLVDFDMLALATTSLDNRGELAELAEPFRRRGGGVDAPFRAAELLRREWHSKRKS